MPAQPRTRLTTVMHSPTRLAILGALRHVQQINFADLQGSLELSTAELSRQLGILERESLVEIAKFRERRHAVTRVRLSPSGREQFEEYLQELRRVVQAELD
ncbi:winged helix-turn-helix domain-containing protein [Streptomyces sp. NPDC002486]